MIIRKVDIGNFGKLENFNFEFSAAGSVIRANNESGKSTILEFIFACLFGMPKKGSSDPSKSPRLKYRSWTNDKMTGSLELRFADVDYRIVVDFGKSAKSDKVHLYRLDDMSEIDLAGKVPANYFLELDATAFRNTVYIPQMSMPLDMTKEQRDEVLQKLSQLSLGALDEENFAGVKVLLTEAYKKILSGRNNALLRRLNGELEKKESEFYIAQKERAEENEAREYLETLSNATANVESDLKKKELLAIELEATITHLRAEEAKENLAKSSKRYEEIILEKENEAKLEIPLTLQGISEDLSYINSNRQKLDKIDFALDLADNKLGELYELNKSILDYKFVASNDETFILNLDTSLAELQENLHKEYEALKGLKDEKDECRRKSDCLLEESRQSYLDAVNKFVKVSDEQNKELGELRKRHSEALAKQLQFEKELSNVIKTLDSLLANTENERKELESLRAEQVDLRQSEEKLLIVSEELEEVFAEWQESFFENELEGLSETGETRATSENDEISERTELKEQTDTNEIEETKEINEQCVQGEQSDLNELSELKSDAARNKGEKEESLLSISDNKLPNDDILAKFNLFEPENEASSLSSKNDCVEDCSQSSNGDCSEVPNSESKELSIDGTSEKLIDKKNGSTFVLHKFASRNKSLDNLDDNKGINTKIKSLLKSNCKRSQEETYQDELSSDQVKAEKSCQEGSSQEAVKQENIKQGYSKQEQAKLEIVRRGEIRENSLTDKSRLNDLSQDKTYTLDEKENIAIDFLKEKIESIEKKRISIYSERAVIDNEIKRIEENKANISHKYLNLDKKVLPKLWEFIIYSLFMVVFLVLGYLFTFKFDLIDTILADILGSNTERIESTIVFFRDNSWLFQLLFLFFIIVFAVRINKYFSLKRFEKIDEIYKEKIHSRDGELSELQEKLEEYNRTINSLEKERADLSVRLRLIEDGKKSRLAEGQWIKERLSQIRGKIFEINLKLQKNLPLERKTVIERDKLLEKKDLYGSPVEALQKKIDQKNKEFTHLRDNLFKDRERKKEIFEKLQEQNSKWTIFPEELELKEQISRREQSIFKLENKKNELVKKSDLLTFKYKEKSYKDLLAKIHSRIEDNQKYLDLEDSLVIEINKINKDLDEFSNSFKLISTCKSQNYDYDNLTYLLNEYDDNQSTLAKLAISRTSPEERIYSQVKSTLQDNNLQDKSDNELILDEFIEADTCEERDAIRRQIYARINNFRQFIYEHLEYLGEASDKLSSKQQYLQRREDEEKNLSLLIADIKSSIKDLIEEDANNLSEDKSISFINRVLTHCKDLGSEAEAKHALQDVKGSIRESQIALQEARSSLVRQDELISQKFQNSNKLELLQSEIEELNKDVARAKKMAASLDLALKHIDISVDDLRKNFWPILRERAIKFLQILTSGKYKDINLDKDMEMKIFDEQGFAHEASYLSGAAYEQIYLSLRLALASILINNNSLPLLLDDITVQFDEERLSNCLSLLNDLLIQDKEQEIVVEKSSARELNEKFFSQVIFFTCQERVGKVCEDLDLPWTIKDLNKD